MRIALTAALWLLVSATCQLAAESASCTCFSDPTNAKFTMSPRFLNSSFTRRGMGCKSFCRSFASGAVETASALMADVPGAAEFSAGPLPVLGAADELGDVCWFRPPNCPDSQMLAALASFDLIEAASVAG